MPGQVWSVSADGGFLYSDQLSDYMRMVLLPTVKYRQFCDADDHTDKGLHAGEAFYWNIYSKVATKGAALSENAPMPTTKFTITQGSGTITEYGNSVPYTGKLDDLSLHPVKTIINKVLKVDATEALDDAAHAQFDATLLTVTPASGNSTTAITLETTGTATATNNVAMNKTHIKLIVDQMKERNIPGYFDNGDYGSVARPSTYRNFKNELESVHQYVNPGFDMILNGEIGRYEGTRFFEQTQIASAAWTNGLSDQAFFFGADTVHEAIAIPEEIRGKIPGDFGRDKGIAWYALLGYKIVHSVAAQSRIIEWASAA